MKRSSVHLSEAKRLGQKIAVLTCYDYPTALALQAAEIDVLLVGDSVGTNLLGYASEREVTLADIAHHVRAVRRGTTDAYLLADLPYGTYPTPATALANARHLVAAGADGVKLEGPQLDTIAYLAAHGIEVCGHVGFEPQHHGQAALKGKQAAEAVRIYDEARAIAESGAFMLVLELVPEELGALISQDVAIPTIGIGAGRATDGQVLVITDVFGFTERRFRHNRRYAEIGQAMREAARRYRDDVRGGGFPGPENAAHMPHEELEAIRRTLRPAD